MKKLLFLYSIIAVLCISCESKALSVLPDLATASFPLRGESDLERSGRVCHVDWIISTYDLVSSTKQSDFKFAYNFATFADQGNYTDYAGSTWFYYFQIENCSGNFATSFSVELRSEVVLTAGYVLDVDLDTDLSLSHLSTDAGLSGEYDDTSAQLENFTSASFDPNPPTPNASLNFDFGFSPGKESTLFFLTSHTPPEYLLAELLAGPQGPLGYLPVPSYAPPIIIIPEPTTWLLLLSSVGVLFYLKRTHK